MIQYGLKLRGRWLGRGLLHHWAGKHRRDETLLDTPDLWQDKERAEELARKYLAQVVKFEVVEIGERDHM